MLRKYRIKLNYAVVAITLCVCVGIVFFAGNLASDNVVTSAIPMDNLPVIILDAGQYAYVLNWVAA